MAYVDPATGAFELTSGKDLRKVTQAELVEQHVVLRLRTHRGSCFWDQTFGSTLHELLKIGPAVARDVEDRVRSALAPMVAGREISSLDIKTERVGLNRIDIGLRCLDAGGRPLQFSTFVEV
ncbi:MAG TPA: hypothetical protein PLA94_07020 [Myxococcota bacterium]|nr:hypothetical protein [Myxococcota bacterium]